MSAVQASIRAEAKRLLESGEVAAVIGFAEGPTPARAAPCLIKSADKVERLIWNPTCSQNLALYLKGSLPLGKIGIVAKACDTRSIAVLIQEKQIKREDVVVIGVPCQGMLDMDSLSRIPVNEATLSSVSWDGEGLRFESSSGSQEAEASQALKSACLFCPDATPAFSDHLIEGQAKTPSIVPIDPLPEELDARRAFWAGHFKRCIRCYACRQVCPSCYCTDCFADRQSPRWVSKRMLGEENWMYHMTRAMHMAARCAGCGECERVCPMGIPLQLLMREMAGEVEQLFDYRAGTDPEAAPALGSFRDNDEGPQG